MSTRQNLLVPNARASARLAVLVVATMLPAGCASGMDPIAWGHQREGGEIAKERPAIPQGDSPYPNLATVPDRPELLDNAARATIAKGLVADRTNAQYTLASAPLSAAPSAVAAPRQAVTGDDSAGATFQAAKTASRVMKPIEVASADPVPAPATKPPVVAGAQKVMQPVKEGRPAEPLSTLPSLAAAPPAPPNLSGVKQATAPTPPTPAPAGFTPPSAAKPVVSAAPVAAPVTQSTASGLRIGFAPGSSTLPGNALAALKVFARERGVRSMVVTGFGDVASSDAQAQAAGLSLALARARGVASYLIAVGVPPAALRVGAEAQGQGAAIRLVD